MPSGGATATAAAVASDLADWAREEWRHPAKRAANLRILRAVAVFVGGVVVSRSYGEYLFVG